MLPVLLAALTSLWPTVDKTPDTFGLVRIRSTICSWCLDISAKEMPCAASV